MKTAHTPGKWEIERVPIESRGGSNTCFKVGPMKACIYDDWRQREAGISELENIANAHLIAAAPELLAALKWILANPFANLQMDAGNEARAAIAKATKCNK